MPAGASSWASSADAGSRATRVLAGEPCPTYSGAEQDKKRASWQALVRRAVRLAFRRTLWGLLGHWLWKVKERGRLAVRDLKVRQPPMG